MKKFVMLLGLVGLGFVGCSSNKNIVWQMGALKWVGQILH